MSNLIPECEIKINVNRVCFHLTDIFHGKVDPDPLFVGKKLPPITLTNYIDRIIKLVNRYTNDDDGDDDTIGIQCTIFAMEYIERANLKLSDLSTHRYFAIACLLGIKHNYDYYISNGYWAIVSGVPLQEINKMEVSLCKLLNWKLGISAEIYEQLYNKFVL
jgi:hypothetical protein